MLNECPRAPMSALPCPGLTSFCSLGKMSWSSMLSRIHTGIMCTQLSRKSTIGSQFLGCHWVTIFRTKGIQTSHISLWEKGEGGPAHCTDCFHSTPPPRCSTVRQKRQQRGNAVRKPSGQSPFWPVPRPDLRLASWLRTHRASFSSAVPACLAGVLWVHAGSRLPHKDSSPGVMCCPTQRSLHSRRLTLGPTA